MKIFKDFISQDEVCTDTENMKVCDDGIFYIVQGKIKTETTQVSDSMFGGNASAEEAGEQNEDAAQSGISLVLSHRLVETAMGKKDFQVYLKGYMKALKARLDINKELKDDWQPRMSAAIKKILAEFKEFQMFMGESMNPDGMIILCKWDGETPLLYLFKDGLEEEKV